MYVYTMVTYHESNTIKWNASHTTILGELQTPMNSEIPVRLFSQQDTFDFESQLSA